MTVGGDTVGRNPETLLSLALGRSRVKALPSLRSPLTTPPAELAPGAGSSGTCGCVRVCGGIKGTTKGGVLPIPECGILLST